jgi:phosphoenolpyruvate---glycerone phosphotransferase subunit DhaL
MMTDRLSRAELLCMVRGAAAQIRKHHARLSELDSAAGDGDHGSAMLRSVDCMEKAMAGGPANCLRTCFEQTGWAVLGADGGASSSLLGSFFLGMRDGIRRNASSLDCRELSAAFLSGLQALRKQTAAQIGEKTMMDAMIPAVETFSVATLESNEIEKSLERASRAAKAGAEATKDLTARHGRGRLLGEKTRGHQDPGATSIALLFEGFYDGLRESKGEAGNA